MPVGNLLGKENKGFQCIMYNFNHERWGMAVSIVAYSRLLLEESMRWATVRHAFGRNLLAQPVIRSKLAGMAAEVEACHAWVELLTYQIMRMSKEETYKTLGGPIALCKAKCSRAMAQVADNAAQVFGTLRQATQARVQKNMLWHVVLRLQSLRLTRDVECPPPV